MYFDCNFVTNRRIVERFVIVLALLGAFSVGASGCGRSPVSEVPDKSEVAEVSSPSSATPDQVQSAPKRIILFIGDGMGVGAVTAATYAHGKPLNMLSMPYVGLATTHEYEFITTDSAASATALATGHKTHFEGVSVQPGTPQADEEKIERHLKSVAQIAQEAGLRTGVVATTRITHATPAAFGAHRNHRQDYESIAIDMSKSGIDVMLGAGSKNFDARKDEADLFIAMQEQGYVVARSAEEVASAQQSGATKLIGLMHPSDMPPVLSGERAMSLAEMTRAAIETLDRDNDNGFFLMVEGSMIDWGGHDTNGVTVVAETLDMDEAVGVALDYARRRHDTLVVVTADHETGGMNVLDPAYVKIYIDALGGQEKVDKSVALPVGENGVRPESPSTAQHIALGVKSVGDVREISEKESADQKYSFGPQELSDRRFTTDFGHLSIASRPYWKSASRFSASHTAAMVPIFAQGPLAASVASVRDNADLGQRLIEIVSGNGALIAADTRGASKSKEDTTRPKNVILLIGDGFGVDALTAAYYVNGSMEMLSMPVRGLVSTHGTDRVVNDSAATATALASGHRTRAGAVGMAPLDGRLASVESVLEIAEARGLRTGFITTTPVTHATPAAFYAHATDRVQDQLIASQLIDFRDRIEGSDGIDFMAGGGAKAFGTNGITELKARGVSVETRWNDVVESTQQPVLRLLANGSLPPASERRGENSAVPSLARMTRTAIDVLDKDQGGFFLMVEGGQIDWALHGLDRSQKLIDEIVDFDDAVQAALEFARRDGNTLVVVTADHDHTLSVTDNHYMFSKGRCGAAKQCGGPFDVPMLPVALDKIHRNEGLSDKDLQGDYAPPTIFLQYSWAVTAANQVKRIPGAHSANFVPLFAEGPGAGLFGGFQDQPEIGRLLVEWARAAEPAN